MKKTEILKYVSIALLSIFIITLSFTFKGLLSVYSSSYFSARIDIPVKKQIMGVDYAFRLPTGWLYNEVKFEGGEILYHADFISSDKSVRGFSEVWKTNTPLLKFLEESKNSSVGNVNYKYYKLEKSKIGIYNGYLLEYSIRGNNGKYYKGLEYFIPSGEGNFFRISFFVPEDKYSTKIDMMIKGIINTIQLKNHIA